MASASGRGRQNTRVYLIHVDFVPIIHRWLDVPKSVFTNCESEKHRKNSGEDKSNIDIY
jgi:hypothetical protein